MKRLLPALLLLTCAAVPASAQTAPAGGQAPTQISTLVEQVAALFPKVAGDVIQASGDTVTLSIGRRDGVVAGVELAVYREGEDLKHPKTGELLGRTEKTLGRVSVIDVFEAYSTAKVVQGTDITAGDKARVSAGEVRRTGLPPPTGG